MANLDLKQLRQKIDHLDNQLAQVFEARLELVRQVARYKQEQGLKVRDNSREAVVLAQCATRVKNPAYVAGLQQLMQQIMTISRELETADMQEQQAGRPAAAMPPQEPTVLTVGYQGVPGAYSQVALTQYFAGYQVQEKNYPLFEDVALAVSKGELDYGVLPIENSSTGGITEVYDLLRRYACFIVGEKLVRVEHHLLGYPGTKLDQVREVYSHPQGFAQCREFFKRYPEMQTIPYYNTAKGAELVAQQKTDYMAAVAGQQAAERYGLAILAPGINANKHNYTRFFVIAKTMPVTPAANKLTLVVALKHEPGSLHQLLGHFTASGLNMLSIESRPIEGKSWEYFFHLDLSGNLAEPQVQKALQALTADGVEYKILGNYVAADQ